MCGKWISVVIVALLLHLHIFPEKVSIAKCQMNVCLQTGEGYAD